MNTRLDSPHLLLGSYVLGGLSDKDRREVVEHLRSCPRCPEELASVAWLRPVSPGSAPTRGPDTRLRLVAELAERPLFLIES